MTDLTGQEDDLVCVKAQVMVWDDNTGGWLPYGEGGISDVALKRSYLPVPDSSPLVEYKVIGQSKQKVILRCVLKKELCYTPVNPTFHRWDIADDRYGLTFERAMDAKMFHSSVEEAVAFLQQDRAFPFHKESEDDQVFMAIDLPLGRKDSSSQSASTTSTTTSSPTMHSPIHSSHNSPGRSQHLHHVKFTSSHMSSSPICEVIKIDSGDSRETTTSSSGRDEIRPEEVPMITTSGKPSSKDDPYVQFTKDSDTITHNYSYPQMEPLAKRETHKKPVIVHQPQLPTKSRKVDSQLLKHHRRCQHCGKYFNSDLNHRGACEYAPDTTVSKCIAYASCMCVAECVIYHCVSDSEGDYGHLCACNADDELNCRRWTVLTLLSLLVPCLWCYWPLKQCHECSIKCGICGARHAAT